jgi:hypothetical protein
MSASKTSQTGKTLERALQVARFLEALAAGGINSAHKFESDEFCDLPEVYVDFADFKRIFAGHRVKRGSGGHWYSAVSDGVKVSACDRESQPESSEVEIEL